MFSNLEKEEMDKKNLYFWEEGRDAFLESVHEVGKTGPMLRK